MLNKERTKQLLYGLELRGTAIIANGLVHRVPKRTVYKQLKEEFLASNKTLRLQNDELEAFWGIFKSRYTLMFRSTYSALKKTDSEYDKKLAERYDVVYDVMDRTVLSRIESEKNQMADVIERRRKGSELDKLMSSGVFYLCSSHVKPAKDHAEWEGKIYVSASWEARIGPDEHDQVKEFIDQNDIRTIEWVTGDPVYMCTRPNCKHYFTSISVQDALNRSVKELLESKNMYMQDKIPMSREKMAYKVYYERLKVLTYLYKMCPSGKLKADVSKTRKLAQKWSIRARSANK